MWNGSQLGSRFKTWEPRDPEGREKDAERKAKAKKKRSKGQSYQPPGPVNAALGALEELRVRGCGFATRAPSHSGIPSFHRC